MPAISQTIDSVAYNKEADQGNESIVEPMTTAATDDIIGVAADPNVGDGVGRGGAGGVSASAFDVFTTGDELRY